MRRSLIESRHPHQLKSPLSVSTGNLRFGRTYMFRAGQQFGIYTLIKQLGRGGYGEVWLAERHTKFATTNVAVKLPLDEQVDHAAIEKEAQLWVLASGHANVLPIIEANEYD